MSWKQWLGAIGLHLDELRDELWPDDRFIHLDGKETQLRLSWQLRIEQLIRGCLNADGRLVVRGGGGWLGRHCNVPFIPAWHLLW